MDENQLITMITKEARRYEIIKSLPDKRIDGTEATKQMNLSVRQIKRIKVRVKKKKNHQRNNSWQQRKEKQSPNRRKNRRKSQGNIIQKIL